MVQIFMPKKKTGQRKKAEKQRELQKKIRSAERPLSEHPCNAQMQCDQCLRDQKSRAFCYFCSTICKLPTCAQCGKQKCMAKTGDCIAFVCHGKKCLTTHACTCPLRNAECIECKRGVWDHGGRIFNCGYCLNFLCEDDQFEHQASCQQVYSENYKCLSCNRLGAYTCMRCKICFCDEHVRRKGVAVVRSKDIPCPKCNCPVKETKDYSVSVRRHEYGRQQRPDYENEDGDDYSYGSSYQYNDGDGGYDYGSDADGTESNSSGDDNDEEGEEEEDDDSGGEDGVSTTRH
ncbi:unnamed protein product [Nippostrongylus brasiliensis]|uniref:Zinc finger protein 330 homolog n=1 Tax=Nippostrongylus brasiliensis TaxID=27835 RepID=A0A0N4YPD6_NIPBR|nr:unnamed protein product [Nippostrongylus brasiliensis]